MTHPPEWLVPMSSLYVDPADAADYATKWLDPAFRVEKGKETGQWWQWDPDAPR